jgi:hypothetical protein
MWSPGDPLTVTVDLGGVRTIGGVRISTHQPNRQYSHPGRIEVAVSTDGEAWLSGGRIEHNDLWQPPGDYEPWEREDSPQYAHLPAGGRLAYSFPLPFEQSLRGRYVRLIFTPLQGRGMGLSEIEVFDEVKTRKASPVVAHLDQ